MDIVQVSRSLERRRAEFAERLVRIVVAVAHHVPPRRLGTKVDLDADEEGPDPRSLAHVYAINAGAYLRDGGRP